jgi:hypothetical protein
MDRWEELMAANARVDRDVAAEFGHTEPPGTGEVADGLPVPTFPPHDASSPALASMRACFSASALISAPSRKM